MISQLNETIKALNKTIADKDAELAWFRKHMYGTSSEKTKNVLEVEGQISLFDKEFDEEKTAELIEPEVIKVPAHTRKPRKPLNEIFDKVPVREVLVDTLTEEDKICPQCGGNLVPIGTEVIRTELIITPPKLERIIYKATTYGCPKCNKEEEETIFVKDNGKTALIDGSYASESLVAYVIQQKFGMYLPLNRLERYFKELNAPITRATMARWIITIANEYIQPLYDYFHRELLKRSFIMMDETPVQVLKETDRKAENKSYFWVCRTGEDRLNPIVLYNYTSTRAGDNAKEFLKGAKPGYYLMSDAFSGYNKLSEAKRCCCYAHIRRKFLEAITKGSEKDFTNPAVQGFMYVNKLFEYERIYKEKGLSIKRVTNRRQKDQKPLVEGFLAWLKTVQPKDNDRLKRAIKYALNLENQLFTYLEDGRCSLHNNLSEQAIRPVTVGRKNWLFSDTPEGAHANALCLTVVQMAKIYELDLYKYVEFILSKRPSEESTDEELENIAPWSKTVQGLCKIKTE